MLLAENLGKLLSDEEKIKKLAEKARSEMKKHFDISNFVNDTLAVYREILETGYLEKAPKMFFVYIQ